MSLTDILATIHEELANDMLARLRGGEATAADLSVIRQFLKDNGIQAKPSDGSPLGNLMNSLPFPTETQAH